MNIWGYTRKSDIFFVSDRFRSSEEVESASHVFLRKGKEGFGVWSGGDAWGGD